MSIYNLRRTNYLHFTCLLVHITIEKRSEEGFEPKHVSIFLLFVHMVPPSTQKTTQFFTLTNKLKTKTLESTYRNGHDRVTLLLVLLIFIVQMNGSPVGVRGAGGHQLGRARRLLQVLQVVIVVVEEHAKFPLLLEPLVYFHLRLN